MKRIPDNLDLDMRMAALLGYGVHYGKYKADHPNTKYSVPIPAKNVITRKCPHCGTEFTVASTKSRKIYCCDDCRMSARYE